MDVKYKDQEVTLPIIVINADRYAPPLLGRDWLNIIRLDWSKLFASGPQYSIATDGIENLKMKYADLFQPELGTVQGVKASLHMQDDRIPIFHKPRPVPFALRPAVENELSRNGK